MRDVKNDSPHPNPKPRTGIAGRIWIAAMGLFLMGLGYLFVTYLWDSYQRASKMDSWVPVPCTVESTEIDDTQLNQKGFPKYILKVHYEYEYEGTTYHSDRIQRLTTESSDPKKVKQKVEEYPPGLGTTCYVNPEDPSFAVLKRDTKAALYSIWFPCLFIVGGAGMVLSALFRKSR